jgi:hypothetical protein
MLVHSLFIMLHARDKDGLTTTKYQPWKSQKGYGHYLKKARENDNLKRVGTLFLV